MFPNTLRHAWTRAGISQVQDISHPSENRLLGQLELQDRYRVSCNFLQALSIRSSIPHSWRSLLSADFRGNTNRRYCMELNRSEVDILNSSPKRSYRELVREVKPIFSRAESWSRDLNDINLLREEIWKDIFVLPFKTSRETKIQSFGFKVANRLTPCGKYLHKIRVRDNPLCTKCKEEDSITHFFLSCPLVKEFWKKLSDWSEQHLGLSLAQLSETEHILGVTRRIENRQLINGLLLTAKYYIQKWRLFYDSDLSLMAFLAETRYRLRTEKTVCRITNRERSFRCWEALANILL